MAPVVRVSLADSLRRVHHRVHQRLVTTLAGAGITPEEWWVLADLAAEPGRPMSAISSTLLLPAPSLTKIVDRMIDQNWVYRRSDSHDRRRVLLFPTVRGLHRHAEIAALVAANEAELAELVGSDALEQLHSALAPVADRLS